MRNLLSMRRVLGLAVAGGGAALLAWGLWIRMPEISLLGLALWLLLSMALGNALRQRANVNMALASACRADIALVLERQEAITASLVSSLESTQKLVVDNGELSLRAYRELSAELAQQRDRIQESLGRQFAEIQLAEEQRESRLVASQSEQWKRADRQAKELKDGLVEWREATNVAFARLGAEIGVNRNDARMKVAEVVTGLARIDPLIAELKSKVDLIPDETKSRSLTHQGMRWLKNEAVIEMSAIAGLPTLLEPRHAMPALTGYSMEPSTTLAMVEDLIRRKPGNVVECGSGVTTIWMSYALEQAGGGRLTSLEHLESYADSCREHVVRHGLQDTANVVHAPLEPYSIDGAEFQWYSKAAVDALPEGIDVLLVDGPPKSTGPMARYPALPVLASKLSDNALIIVDDTDRPEEKKAIARWRELFPGLGEPVKLGARAVAMQYRRE